MTTNMQKNNCSAIGDEQILVKLTMASWLGVSHLIGQE